MYPASAQCSGVWYHSAHSAQGAHQYAPDRGTGGAKKDQKAKKGSEIEKSHGGRFVRVVLNF